MSPRLRALLARVREKHGLKHPEIEGIEKLFGDVVREMIMHMQKGEQILFSYIDALEISAKLQSSLEPPFFQTVRDPIHIMMQEHAAAGEIVKEIRRVTAGYKAHKDACTTFKASYQGLQEFEEDLHEHVHLENNILFPKLFSLKLPS